MNAGPELDALLAEKVMGLKPDVDFGKWEEHTWAVPDDEIECEFSSYVCTRCRLTPGWLNDSELPGGPCVVKPLPYSSAMSLAWLLVKKLIECHPGQGFLLVRMFDLSGRSRGWGATFDLGTPSETADTEALAICRAALVLTEVLKP
jgi:hypothetical protein